MSVHLLFLFRPEAGEAQGPAEAGDFDDIEIDGQIFPVKGPIRGNATSEFETGIKIGPATYDQRENAFYLVLNDFSGGLGHRRLDIREELGTYWDVDPTNAADTRRPGHITLGPWQVFGTPFPSSNSPTVVDLTKAKPSQPVAIHRLANPTPCYVIGYGNAIYTTEDGTSWTRRYVHPSGKMCKSIVAWNAFDGSGYTYRLVATFWHDTGAPDYVISSNGINWDLQGNKPALTDVLVWDKKLIGVKDDFSIAFAVKDQNGEDTWNTDDPADGETITEVAGSEVAGGLNLIGVLEAPWGEPAVYFRDSSRIFVLDFFRRTHVEIDFGGHRRIEDAKIWNGNLVFTDGWNVIIYNPAAATTRNIGLPRESGAPPSLVGYHITCLAPADDYLYATLVNPSTNKTRVMCWNGVGWHQFGREFAGYSAYLFMGTYPVTGQVTHRFLHVLKSSSPTTADLAVEQFDIPNLTHVPTVGGTSWFGYTGASFMTGWIDGGFADIEGILLRLNIDAFNLSPDTEGSAGYTVKVEFQLDNDETMDWIQMVDENYLPAVFDSPNKSLYFPEEEGNLGHGRLGRRFRTVRFRFTLNRPVVVDPRDGMSLSEAFLGGFEAFIAPVSPEIRAITLVYLKTPNVRTSWTFEIDINRMIESSATGNDTRYYVDGEPATLARVWAKMRSLWNTKRLLPMTIPNVDTLLVRLTDMPVTFDDFRDSIGGRGTITVTALEPLGS